MIMDAEDEEELRAMRSGRDEAGGHRVSGQCRRKVRSGEFVGHVVGGMDLCYAVLRGKRLVVPVEGTYVKEIIEHLLSRKGEAKNTGTSESHMFRSLLTDQDKKRVFWRDLSGKDASYGHWLVRYTDEKGARCMHSKGLWVSRTSKSGDTFNAEDAVANARAVLKKARRYWNLMDGSGDEKYIL